MTKGEDYGLEDISSYTSSLSESSGGYSSSYESSNYEPNSMLQDIFSVDRSNKPKRGRRPLRPYDPIRKKTEEKDKYWLRAFRCHVRKVVESKEVVMSDEELEFWEFYLGPNGKPGKGHRYLSYGKKYKGYLFSNPFFVDKFRAWFDQNGESLLLKKYEPGTAEWFVFFDYAARDLYHYASSQEKKIEHVVNVHTLPNIDDEFVIEDNMDIVDNIL
jgi:hypothetical protein